MLMASDTGDVVQFVLLNYDFYSESNLQVQDLVLFDSDYLILILDHSTLIFFSLKSSSKFGDTFTLEDISALSHSENEI